MRKINFLAVICITAIFASCSKQGVSTKELKTEVDSVSYALGLNMANQLKINFDDVDQELFVQGFKNGLDSSNIKIENGQATAILRSFFTKRQAEMQKKQQEEALKKIEKEFAQVKEDGEKFLAENKTKEGVTTTDSGLQYMVIKEGTGKKPGATDRVKVHYHGTLADGTIFDSSVDKGTPAEFAVNGVIKGWTEGLQLMPAGSKYKFFVPQELAYGAFPRRGGKVRPFDPLVFEVELLEVKDNK